MEENFNVFDFTLSDEDMNSAQITAVAMATFRDSDVSWPAGYLGIYNFRLINVATDVYKRQYLFCLGCRQFIIVNFTRIRLKVLAFCSTKQMFL